MYGNLIFQSNINPIGGCETVIYNIAHKYTDRDLTVMYVEGNPEQVYRLSRYCQVVQFKGQSFECERLFVNYGWDVIKDFVNAKEKYYIVHANYAYLNKLDNTYKHKVPDGFDGVFAVSDWAGMNSGVQNYTVCPNPVVVEDEDCLLLVSATRLAEDKGGIKDRMNVLANRLDERGIKFVWLVFTNSLNRIENPSVVNMPGRLDIMPYLKKADFTIQLSDSEACCMTALESLSLGTPMCVTKIPSFYEQGLNDDNAVFFDFDMSNVDECIDRMISRKYNFKFTPKPDIWGELLIGKRKEKLKPMKRIRVKATDAFQMSGGLIAPEIGRVPMIGEEFTINDDRLAFYLGDNKRHVKYVEVVEEPKKAKKDGKDKE